LLLLKRRHLRHDPTSSRYSLAVHKLKHLLLLLLLLLLLEFRNSCATIA
jgi:hypothetical protein